MADLKQIILTQRRKGAPTNLLFMRTSPHPGMATDEKSLNKALRLFRLSHAGYISEKAKLPQMICVVVRRQKDLADKDVVLGMRDK